MKDHPSLSTTLGNAFAIAVLGFVAFLIFGAGIFNGLVDFAHWMGAK